MQTNLCKWDNNALWALVSPCEPLWQKNDNGLGLLNENTIWIPDSLQVQDSGELLRYHFSKE